MMIKHILFYFFVYKIEFTPLLTHKDHAHTKTMAKY
jgi:hypothetical protein